MEIKLQLSDWLLENLDINSKIESIETQAGLLPTSDPSEFIDFENSMEDIRVGAYRKMYELYRLYSRSYSRYSFYRFSYSKSYSKYSFYSLSYSKSYSKYSFYSLSYSFYSLYSFYSFYSFSYYDYDRYYLYSFYNYCESCQLCQTCQGKCETAQSVKDYIGEFSFNETLQSDTEITDDDWNKMVDWIKAGAPYNLQNAPSLSAVAENIAISKDRINEVNSSIGATFVLDSTTGVSTKASGDSALASDLVKLVSSLNSAKIDSLICTNNSLQTCIHCQLGCQVCQDSSQA